MAGVLDELHSQLIPLSGVAVQARHPACLHRLDRVHLGRYGYSAERALLSKVRLKLQLALLYIDITPMCRGRGHISRHNCQQGDTSATRQVNIRSL